MVGKYKQILLVVCSIFVFSIPVFSVQAAHEGYPVVIVPGMLASFDKKLMLQDIEDNKWGFVWGGNVYKALIKELEGGFSQYEEGKSLFVAYYDWRKPVSENWQKYLKPKIDEAKRISGQNKVDIIAHSMGGLLARTYIESDGYENDVNKLVLMGTPNYGASDAYVTWEGGEYPQSWNSVYKTYLKTIQLVLSFVRNKHLSSPLSFREFFPGLRDLLPTTKFVKSGNDLLELSSMADKNNFLLDLNNNIDSLKTRVKEVRTYAGHTGKTMDEITIGGVCTIEDNQNQRWRDGHPNPDPPTANSTEGDETVLLSSAVVPNVENFTLDGTSHTKIPDDARYQIPNFLNPPMLWYLPQPFRTLAQNLLTFPTARADGDEYIAPDSMLSFTVSPNVNFELIDPDGKILSRDKNELGEDNANFDDDPADSEDIILVTIRNPKVGKYTLKITGNTGGDYYVDSTFVNDNGVFDDENAGTIKEGEEKTLVATVSETKGVDFPASETEEGNGNTTTTDDNNKTESKTSNTSGPNTAKKHSGLVLGVTTMRMKLSQIILSVRQRLTREIASPTHHKGAGLAKTSGLTKKDFNLLIGPVNEMLARARAYEIAKTANKTKLAADLLIKIKEDYLDFENKVDRLIVEGKLNQQTVNVLTALKQRLANAGLR